MKKDSKVFILMFMVVSLFFLMGSFTLAAQISSDQGNIIEPMGMSRVSIYADRTSSTSVKISASGSLSSMADKITTTATLYEYNSATGALTKANASPVVMTSYNCTSYSFNCNFSIAATKSYKVKLVIDDYTDGKINTTIAYSTVF